MTAFIGRREFTTLLGGAAVAWPVAARAQQGERMRRLGLLLTLAADDPETKDGITVFQQRLQQAGWSDGRNVQIEYRVAEGDADRIRKNAAELVAAAPDVIFALGTANVGRLLQVTRTVPIVFAYVADPVGAGFAESLARPGGNATGFIQFDYGLSAKWLELLKEIAPGVTRAASPSRCRHIRRHRPVGCHPDCGASVWGGGEPHQCARSGRDRARRR